VGSWYSIEVIDGAVSAAGWAEAWSDALSSAALSSGAIDWSWHQHTWGVVFETEFADEAAWEAFRELATVRAALDAVPDPISGLIVYRGRGGSAGSAEPRKPKPMIGSGSAELPLPWDFVNEWPVDLSALAGPTFRRPLLVGSLV
jgi:hypothetical protein